MIKFKYILLSALEAIRLNKSRSFLTVLGIVIGVASIIMIMSLGSGAQNLILGEISQMGAETVMVLPGDFNDPQAVFSDSLTIRDYEAILVPANAPNLVSAMPAVIIPGNVSYLGETYTPGVMLGAAAEFFGQTFNVFPSAGVMFTDVDINSNARVAIIGNTVKNELFGPSDAVGERINIRGTQFRVVGVYGQTGQRGVFDIDDLVIVPYTTAQTYLVGSNHFQRIIARADSPDNVDKLAHDIRATLRETHNLYPGEKDDFAVVTQQGLLDQISVIIGILTAFLTAVVAISLVVGGIGVMNIMLVSVTERTREIGLRKALGATKRAILWQFLTEAVVLTMAGGVIGILLGGLASFGISIVLSQTVAAGWSFSFPVGAAVLGVGVSAAVGLIFGLYPAKRAADKSPIEALRYE